MGVDNLAGDRALIAEIESLRKEKRAVILAHYYQQGAIQDIADHIGDSLALARYAATLDDARIIVLCGVHFMGETAKLLCPDKKVLVPDASAGCSLADSCPPAEFEKFVEAHPGHTVVSYVNTSVGVKALTDILVTSGNARRIIDSLPADEKIIFGPDRNLGNYINSITGRRMVLWDGACHVHEKFSLEKILALKAEHPEARVLVHPECTRPVREIADKVGALLMIDMAHTAGLIAVGLLDNPVKYAHVVTSTTHKTLRGPRGGIILMGKDFDNPWGLTTPKGVVKKMSQIINSAVFPGIQGGPLEHVIAAKAVAFGEALSPEYKEYQKQVIKNAQAMAEAFVKRGYKIVSGGTDNHLMLVDLRTKFPELTGKLAEKCLVAADITTNKNMVPFDSRSAFQTSGLRFGTPAITTRGVKEDKMDYIVELIDRVLQDPENEQNIAAVRSDVNKMMAEYPLFAW